MPWTLHFSLARGPADVVKLKRTDIRDGALWLVQNNTGARIGIEVTGELEAVLDRINTRRAER